MTNRQTRRDITARSSHRGWRKMEVVSAYWRRPPTDPDINTAMNSQFNNDKIYTHCDNADIKLWSPLLEICKGNIWVRYTS